MGGHHLILGKLNDIVTGEILDDTLDERYRQKLARILLEEKGYAKQDIIPRYKIIAEASDKRAALNIDFIVKPSAHYLMLIRFGPGSLITRHRPALAFSRTAVSYQIPVVVVTNGEDADILDGSTGKLVESSLNAIPHKETLMSQYRDFVPKTVGDKARSLELRILYAYEVDGSCPCDDTICKIPPSDK